MSYVIAAPEIMTSAATDLATIGSNLSAADAAAATRTTGMLAAAEDEVSAAIAAVFSAPLFRITSASHLVRDAPCRRRHRGTPLIN